MWLEQSVWPDARQQGISRATYDHALGSIGLKWDLPDLQPPGRAIPSGDQKQAEFQSPGRYFVERQIVDLTTTGKGLLNRWKTVLDQVESTYGVPREIVVAIWGRESHFGRVVPRHDALSVLATQAFMGRRGALYRPEFLAALTMVEKDHVPEAQLLSSWAGAMGQPQFLPSKYLRYAVDGDGDGRRDIWRSVPDSLASIAHFLREHGWRPDRGWGEEVRVPSGVPCTLEGPRQGRPGSEWTGLGIVPATGRAGAPRDATRFLLMPAGRLGPAFLVTDNFYILKQYNESDLYALFIGHVADRLGGTSSFSGTWAPTASLNRGTITVMQRTLQDQGYDVGKADGLVGFATRTAIGEWQRKSGREATCYPDADLIRAIR
ncbi:lytic murein transglycosylase [Microvirga sp. BT291]|nr:lytic murein transglycosylase [Microvirga pudoricolor]